MKYAILVLFVLTTINSFAQERLTIVEGLGTSERNVLKEIDGIQYILTIDYFDSLNVYRIENGGAIYLHGTQLYGLNEELIIMTTDHFLLTESIYGSIAYNFIEGTETLYPYEEGYSRTQWKTENQDKVILRQSSNDYELEVQYLLDLNTNERLDIDDEYVVLDQLSNHLVVRDYIDTENSIYMLLDKQTEQFDTIVTSQFYYGEYAVDEYNFYFLVDSVVHAYRIADKSTEVLYDLGENIRSADIILTSTGVTVEVLYNDGFKKMLTINHELDTKIYDLQKYDEVYSELVGDYWIADGDASLVLLHAETGDTIQFNFLYTKTENIIVLDNRYLILHGSYNVSNNNVSMIDIETLEFSSLIDNSVGGYGEITYLKLEENKYLFNYDVKLGENKTLIEIDLNSKSSKFAEILNSPSNGLSNDSKLYEIGGNVFLISSDIYHVHGDQVVKLNQFEFKDANYRPFKIIDDQIYWVEVTDNRFTINTFGELGYEVVADVEGHVGASPWNWLLVQNYTVTDDYVFYMARGFLENKLYRYNRSDGNIVTIVEDVSSNSSVLYGKDSYVYYGDGSIKVISPDQSIQALPLIPGGWPTDSFYEFKETLFLITEDGLYTVDESDYEEVFQFSGSNFVNFYDLGDLLYITDETDKKYLYDGELFTEIEVDENFSISNISSDYLIVNQSTGVNTTSTQILDATTNTYYELPDSIVNLRIVGLFSNDNKLVLVGTSGSFPFQKVEVYTLDMDFTNFARINIFESSGRGVRANLVTYENEAFLYAGSRFFLMRDNLDFVPIYGLAGDPDNTKVIEQDGYFYFVAFHPDFGRQLYRIQVFSERSSSIELLSKDKLWTQVNVNDEELYSYRVRVSDRLKWLSGNYFNQLEISNEESGDVFTTIDYYVREESGKVWMYTNEEERLIYNFNVDIGDEFSFDQDGENVSLVLENIGSIEDNSGDIRRVFIFESSLDDECQNGDFYWIEGVGSNKGLVLSSLVNSIENPCVNLSCMQVKDAVIYSNSDFATCFVVGVSNLDADEFILYPNPSSGDVFIESSHKIESIRIHDLMGAQVKEVGSSTFSVSELTSGIYLLNIRIESGQEAIKKIVVY